MTANTDTAERHASASSEAGITADQMIARAEAMVAELIERQAETEDRGFYAEDIHERFARNGGLVLGICNGFQTLVKTGLLPGEAYNVNGHRSVTLTFNESAHFECQWVYLQANPNSSCLFTEGLDELIHCPVAHGEGRLAVANQAMLDRLYAHHSALLRQVRSYSDSRYRPGDAETR